MAVPDMDIVIRWANKIQQAAREVRNMPVTEETFNNYLKSQMCGEWRDVLTNGIRDELISSRGNENSGGIKSSGKTARRK